MQQFQLLEMPGNDKARSMLASKGVDIDAELARVVKGVDRTEVDLWDPGSVAGVLVGSADVLEAENQGPLWANISTGPNPWCVAASLAASFAAVQVFHVTRDGTGIVRIPSIRQDRPTSRELQVLRLMPAAGEISGTLLKRHLREAGFFRKSTSDKPAKNREQGQLDREMTRLVKWSAVEKGKRGDRNWYRQGPAANCLLKMFGHRESSKRP